MSAEPSIDQRVAFERVRVVYRNVPSAFVAAMTVSLYLVGTSWPHVDHRLSLGWLAVMVLLQGLRFQAALAYRRAPADPALAPHWAARYRTFILLTGAVWATSGFVFMKPGDPISHAMVMMGMYGLGAGVVPGLAYLPEALAPFLVLIFVPLAARLALLGGLEYAVLAAATLLFMAVLLGFGRNTAHTIRESIRVRFENLDLLEQVRREKDAAEDAQRRAENANRSKSQFFAAASHDLRQPLQALGLYAHALRSSATPAQLEVVEHVGNSVQSLESLFDELLDISRLDAGVVVPRPAHFRAREMTASLRSQFDEPARQKGLRLHLDDRGAVLHGDRLLLTRILANLIANAVRYTDRGTVLVACRRRGDAVRIEVRDSGIGIREDQHRRIFEEFYQLENPERDRRKGLGLGLATVDRLSRLLAVPLELRSAPGRGSVFAVTVPRGDPARIETSSAPEAPRDRLQGCHVLVVDDEESIRDGLRRVLEQWGCTVTAAADGEDALARLGENAPDLMIADYRLAGGQDGVGAAGRLRARYGATLPCLLMTGDTAPERLQTLQAGGWHVLHKPVRPVQLRAACNSLLAAVD